MDRPTPTRLIDINHPRLVAARRVRIWTGPHAGLSVGGASVLDPGFLPVAAASRRRTPVREAARVLLGRAHVV